jgi:3-keto-disaccharide hydrolase
LFVDYNTHFRSFELSGEYRVFDSIRAALVVELTTDRPGLRPPLNADFKPTDGWRSFSARVEPQAWTMTVDGKVVENYRVPAKREPNIEYPTVLSARIHCYVPERAGGRLELRNLKLRPLDATPLFNGTDLSGWKVFRGDLKRMNTKFEVTAAGELSARNGPGDLQTEKQFDNFVLQLECKTNGKGLNSGVFFRCVPDQYQNGYEAQIHNGFKDNDRTKPVDFGTGAIYRRVPARKVVSNDREWFTLTVVVDGPHIGTWVNGYQTVDWTDDRKPADNPRHGRRLAKGHISLQGHDPTTDVLFRNIRITKLPAGTKGD